MDTDRSQKLTTTTILRRQTNNTDCILAPSKVLRLLKNYLIQAKHYRIMYTVHDPVSRIDL